MTGKHWTEDELIYLEYFVYENDTELKEASDFLGRSVHAILKKLWQLRKKDSDVSYMHRLWTDKEEEFLRKHYKTLTNKNIARRLNRSVGAVEFRAAKLGLRKHKSIKMYDKEIRDMLNEGNYLIDICNELNIKMSSLIAYCKSENISYIRMSQEEKNRRNPDSFFKQLERARYAEYLSKKREK